MSNRKKIKRGKKYINFSIVRHPWRELYHNGRLCKRMKMQAKKTMSAAPRKLRGRLVVGISLNYTCTQTVVDLIPSEFTEI